jgi:hypothetical protein
MTLRVDYDAHRHVPTPRVTLQHSAVNAQCSDQHYRLRRVSVVIQPLTIHETIQITISDELIMASRFYFGYEISSDGNGKSSLSIHDICSAWPENILFDISIQTNIPQDERNSGTMDEPYLVADLAGRIAETVASALCSEVCSQTSRGHECWYE